MPVMHDLLLSKLQVHSDLSGGDIAALRRIPYTERPLSPDEDIVRQGKRPAAAAVVLRGMVARYHTLATGRRQYLSLHIAGDMPDVQSVLVEVMDHAVCAVDRSVAALVPHAALLALFEERPAVAFAIWRGILIEAAMLRQAITNNSARPLPTRLAHFFCEQFYRARAGGHAQSGSCSLPLTQTQIGEMLGASLPSISRALHFIRQTKSMELRGGELHVRNWARLSRLGDFDPSYLHLKKPRRL